MSRQLVGLSHTVRDGLITYKGLPAPIITEFLSREDSREHYALGTEFHIGKIELVANTGTYVDSPFHRFAQGMDLSELPLSSLADLPGIVVKALEYGNCIPADAFQGLDLSGKAVLVRSGWTRHWGSQQYFSGHPFLDAQAATYLLLLA